MTSKQELGERIDRVKQRMNAAGDTVYYEDQYHDRVKRIRGTVITGTFPETDFPCVEVKQHEKRVKIPLKYVTRIDYYGTEGKDDTEGEEDT